MNYDFPVIKTIDDVLPYIRECSDFIVANKGDYSVINYVAMSSDTFRPPIDGVYSTESIVRRECRGLIFDNATGRIIRRPLHKFFNVNEREETLIDNLRFGNETIYNKLDGSMIAPFVTSNGKFWVGTKMGETDIALMAKYHCFTADVIDRCKKMISNGITPIFEFTSPYNTVVIRYSEPKLRLIAAREMATGKYISIERYQSWFDLVDSIKLQNVRSVDLPLFISKLAEVEGIVLSWPNGHKVKIKTDWYVAIHKVKDNLLQARNVVSLIVNEQMDDVYPYLDAIDKQRLQEYQDKLINWMRHTKSTLEAYMLMFATHPEPTRKNFALEVAPKLGPFAHTVFKDFDYLVSKPSDLNERIYDGIKQTLLRACNSNSSLNEFINRVSTNVISPFPTYLPEIGGADDRTSGSGEVDAS